MTAGVKPPVFPGFDPQAVINTIWNTFVQMLVECPVDGLVVIGVDPVPELSQGKS